MRPYKFRIRLSSRRLNVTRPGKGTAAAWRAAARLSLGSASSDIELMERLLSCPVLSCHVMSCVRHDRANRGPLQEGLARAPDFGARRIVRDSSRKRTVTGSLA